MKKLICVLLVVALMFVFVSCNAPAEKNEDSAAEDSAAEDSAAEDTAAEDTAAEDSAGETFVLKYNLLENEDHGQSKAAQAFKEKVEELSGGQIEVQIYYNASLYTQDGAFPAHMSGELEMTHIAIQQFAELIPSVAMYASTYIFNDYDHMKAVMESEIGDELSALIEEETGVVPLAYYYNGARQLNLRGNKEITKPEDLSSVVLRMPNSDAWIAAGEALGAKVSPLSRAEVYTALQTGTIDAQDNPLPGTVSSKYYEVTDQIVMTHHIIDFAPISVAKTVWDKMTDEQKGWMYEAAKVGAQACDDEILRLESELVSFLEGEGLKVSYPDVTAFVEYAQNYYLEHNLNADWDMDVYNKIKEMG